MSSSLPFFLEQYLIRNWWGKKEPQRTDVLTFYIHSMFRQKRLRCSVATLVKMLHLGTCECPPFWVHIGLQAYLTSTKTNIFAENGPSQNETCPPLPPCFKTKPLVSEGVYDFSNSLKAWWVEMICNLLKTNMSPENQWLEEIFPFEIVHFLGDMFVFHVWYVSCAGIS